MGWQNSRLHLKGQKIFDWTEGKALKIKSWVMVKSWRLVTLEMERIFGMLEFEKDWRKHGQTARVFILSFSYV